MTDPTHPPRMRTDAPAHPDEAPASQGQHLATVSHGGLLWDVYVEHEDDPRRSDSFAGRLCFSPAGGSSGLGPVRTAPILIEPSYEEVFYRARAFEEHHLVSLLRSCLPDDAPDGDGDAARPDDPAVGETPEG